MIVKFRDNNIARLEKIVKEKQEVEPALQETIVRSAKVAALLGFHLFSILERLEVKFDILHHRCSLKYKSQKWKKYLFLLYTILM